MNFLLPPTVKLTLGTETIVKGYWSCRTAYV